MVPPTSQEETLPLNVSVSVHGVHLARSGLDRVTGSPSPGLDLLTSVPGGTDQLRVCGDPINVTLSVASTLSLGGLLFPFF